MSETFYIKKTAFDDNNFDLTQRETDSFIIGPGELNGPAGLARDSDLELYGFGSLKWGEGVDQNQYRLMESSACLAKVTGDFLVGTDTADGFEPGTGSFDTGTDPITPKDERDLGIGNGITEPLIGQIWYNTFDKILYNYELTGWITVFQEVTDVLTDHAADTTLHLDAAQNTFLDGLTLGSPLLTSYDVNQLIGMTNTQGIFTVQGQLDLMVEKAGDTMTGNLTVGAFGEPANSVSVRAAASGNSHYWLQRSDGSNQGLFYANTSTDEVHVRTYHTDGVSLLTDLILGTDGNVSISGSQSLIGNKLTRVDYVQNFLDRRIDQSMTSGRSITFSGGGEVRGLPLIPGSNTDAASKNYVDIKTQIARSTIYSTAGTFTFTVPTGINMVFVSGSGAGQGGQGGGDGPTGTPTIPSRPADSYVSGSLGIIRLRGGKSTFGVLQDGIHVTHSGRNVQNLAAMEPGQQPSSCVDGDNCIGGRGGHSAFGSGGAGTSSVGLFGTKGGGGGGGFAQDFLEGQNFGWGGASGGFVFSAALPVTSGSNLSVRISSGTSGSSGASGRNGGGGGTAYIILSW